MVVKKHNKPHNYHGVPPQDQYVYLLNQHTPPTLFVLTGKTQIALLVADNQIRPALVLWERLVKKLFQTEVAFPSYQGEEAKHIDRVMETAAKRLGHSLPRRRPSERKLKSGTSDFHTRCGRLCLAHSATPVGLQRPTTGPRRTATLSIRTGGWRTSLWAG